MRRIYFWRAGPVLAALVVLGLLSKPAQAQPHRVCLYLDLGDAFWDASPRAADGKDFREEYGRNEGPTSYPAQRWLAHVVDAATGLDLFGWEPLDGSGCAAFELPDDGAELAVEWMRWAVWDREIETGNQIVGYRCVAAMDVCFLDPDSRITAANLATGTTDIVVGPLDVVPVDAVLWSASFAEERFASIDEQPLHNARIYVSHDPLDVLPGRTQADRTFGNQPSVVIEGLSWHSKYTTAHEVGHQQTIGADNPSFGPDDLDYCYAAAAGCRPDHGMESHEWQAAAAVEGIAHWYAVSVWNDVDIVECPNCQPGVRYVSPRSASDESTFSVPRMTPLCTAPGRPQCPSGVGNEWDWLSAFRLFRLQAPTRPSFRTMFRMVSAAYASGQWSPRSATGAFWTTFDQTMAVHLGPNHAAWQQAAAEMELDR